MLKNALRLLGVISLAVAAGILALEVVVLAGLIGRYGPFGWLVAAIVLSVWMTFVVPFVLIGVELLWGDRPRRGVVLHPRVPAALSSTFVLAEPTARVPAPVIAPLVARENTAWRATPALMAEVWPTWPVEAEHTPTECIRARPAEHSSCPLQRTPYGLDAGSMAAVIALASIVTLLYVVLAPQ